MIGVRYGAVRAAVRITRISPNLRRPVSDVGKKSIPVLLSSGLSYLAVSNIRRLQCKSVVANPVQEDPWLLVPQQREIHSKSTILAIISFPWHIVYGTWRVIRKLVRCLSLSLRFMPLIISYPITSRFEYLNDQWWKLAIFILQTSGPTFIKLGQWASTRRDIFSKQFCDRISVLHTRTKRKRYFRDCERVLDEMFGDGFLKKYRHLVFTHIEPYSIGSGCIAQVYKATIDVEEMQKALGRHIPNPSGEKTMVIAIKVADDGVEQQIEMDLSIIRSMACIAQRFLPSLSYLDPMGALLQFEMVLRRQVDLANEAKALMRFSENFEHTKTGIRFPAVLAYTRNAIAETYEEGINISKLVAEENNSDLSARQSPAVRRRVALMGARALLKMIFVDNFVHGDLHPGNILVRFNMNTPSMPGVHRAPPSEGLITRGIERLRSLIGWRGRPRVRFTDSPDMNDEPTLVLLDTGIALSETEKNLQNLKALFRAVVEKKGYDAGKLLLSQSPNQKCIEPERFCRQVEVLVNKARSEKSLRTLNISALLSEMFTIVAEHKVSLDSSFTSVILSVMVLEGFGRSLDPDLDLFQCARPYLLNVLV